MEERPSIPMSRHPLMKRLEVASKPIEEMLNSVVQWARYQIPGAMIYGRQRLGKSRAIEYVIPLLKEHLESDVPVYLVSLDGDFKPTQRSFLEELLVASGYLLSRGATAKVARHRLVEFWASEAENVQENRVMLFIDEAQWLNDHGYRWLMDIHNQLQRRRINLITILVGQPELLTIRTAYRVAGELQIVARFMARAHAFRGLCSASDLAAGLKGVDERCRYPVGSDWTYTRFFVPQAYANGWRLAHNAALIWSVLEDAYPWDSSKAADRELPMAAFDPLCKFILSELYEVDAPELTLPEDLIREGIEYAYLPAMQVESR